MITDNVLKHHVDSSFLVRSIVLLTMKYPDIIESKCPMIYLWLKDNSIPFVAAVFDELKVSSIYQDSLLPIYDPSPGSLFFIESHLFVQIYAVLQRHFCCAGGVVILVWMLFLQFCSVRKSSALTLNTWITCWASCNFGASITSSVVLSGTKSNKAIAYQFVLFSSFKMCL